MINTKFWSDSFIDSLEPTEKLLFLYLLTNDKTNICGIYELPLRIMANETQIPKNKIADILGKLEPKVTYFDGWVCVHNFAKHQQNNEKVRIGIERALELVPERIIKHIDSLSKAIHSVPKRSININSNSNSNSNSNINRIGDSEIKEMFDFWEHITGTPVTSNLAKNKRAVSGLLKRHGSENVKQMIKGAALAQTKDYAPQISNFIKLSDKWEALIVWGKKQGNNGKVVSIS